MKGALELSSIQEASGQENAERMVESIISDFSQLLGELKEGMEMADQENDETTGDMLLAIYSSLEKHIWMLRAFSGK